MQRIFKLLTSILMILLLLCSCGGEEEDASLEMTLTQTTEETITDAGEDDESQEQVSVNSFDGFVPYVEGTRPFAVMIDNEGSKVLPQGGLQMAQLVYEIIVEGGESRLMPVFWGVNPEMIGPVRSSRHYFLDYAMEHDAIYVHFGWSPMAQRDIGNLKINNINGVGYGGEIFWDLTKDRNNWQDSYTSMDRIQKFVQKAKYRTETKAEPVFAYHETDRDLPAGLRAHSVEIKYSPTNNSGFEYDEDREVYKRFRKGKPHMERLTGEQIVTENIIIQFTENWTLKGDTQGRQDVKTVSSGKGYYISRGRAIEIKWAKTARSSPTVYTDERGEAIRLNPGPTWIQLAPSGGKVTVE